MNLGCRKYSLFEKFSRLSAILAAVFSVSVFATQLSAASEIGQFDRVSYFVDRVDNLAREKVAEFNRAAPFLKINNPDAPLVQYGDAPLYDVEIKGALPFSNILFAGYNFYTSDNTMGLVRDSHHRLLASRYRGKIEKDQTYTDVFLDVVGRHQFTAFKFFLQNTFSLGGISNKKVLGIDTISVYTKKLARSSQHISTLTSSNVSVVPLADDKGNAIGFQHQFVFPGITSEQKDIAARGTSFSISNVAAVFIVDSKHQLKRLEESAEKLIGSMSVQHIAYQRSDGTTRALHFHGTDLLEVSFVKESGSLMVEAYQYDFRERTTRGSEYEPDSNNTRFHPNLAITSVLPENRITITDVESSAIVFPLWQPDGALATFAMTEHADYVGVAQDNWTMYGNAEGKFAAGIGILGNRLSVTKSVFPVGNDVVLPLKGAYSKETLKIKQANVADTVAFQKQLDGYREGGFDVEIAAHCAGVVDVKTEKSTAGLIQLLKVLQRYGAVTWVDHGGIECIWESGWNPRSPNYLVPALKENGYKYLNARDDKYVGNLTMISDGEPGNMFYYVPRFDDDPDDGWKPYFFATAPVNFPSSSFTKEHIENIIKSRGILNTHTYLPRQLIDTDPDETGRNELKNIKWYERIFRNIADAKERGDLYQATTRDVLGFMNYVKGLKFYSTGTELVVQDDRDTLMQRMPAFAYVPLKDTAEDTLSIKPTLPLRQKISDGVSYFIVSSTAN